MISYLKGGRKVNDDLYIKIKEAYRYYLVSLNKEKEKEAFNNLVNTLNLLKQSLRKDRLFERELLIKECAYQIKALKELRKEFKESFILDRIGLFLRQLNQSLEED